MDYNGRKLQLAEKFYLTLSENFCKCMLMTEVHTDMPYNYY